MANIPYPAHASPHRPDLSTQGAWLIHGNGRMQVSSPPPFWCKSFQSTKAPHLSIPSLSQTSPSLLPILRYSLSTYLAIFHPVPHVPSTFATVNMRFTQLASIAALASTSAAQVVVIGGEGGLCLDLDSPGCGQGGKPSSDGHIGGSKTSSAPASSAKPSSSDGWGHSSAKPSSSAPVSHTTVITTAYTTYCPGPTTISMNNHTYTATGPTTLTITNCPCTFTHPGPPPVKTNPPVPTVPVVPPAVVPTAGAEKIGAGIGALVVAGVAALAL
ncbi:Putative KLTH0H07414p [[Torrubiella] hemipterigena]|uniref:Putative KLTH0H07414p n=1 Tax=[Torrubiella] hemipterigena TaxID=1531966 RepID=A0A0A1T463_9HYPO|nr:Putative KLTH0H07414p [[Torrubiella] hemipterigena]